MFKKLISARAAKVTIALLFTLTLVCFMLFLYSAQALGAQPAAATPPNPMQQKLLEEQLSHAGQLRNLEQQLAEAQLALAQAEESSERLAAGVIEAEGNLSLAYAGEFYATAYCCEAYPHICGGNGVTASGTVPTPGLTCAADWNVFPPGTWLYIEGVGLRRVEDSGSAIRQNRLDIAIDTHENALRWRGQGNHHVWVLSWEDDMN